MSAILVWTLVTVLLTAGLIGTMVPGLPGIGLILAGITVYAMTTKFTTITMATLAVMAVVAAAALLMHYYASALGARAAGGGRLATTGAVIGALGGLLMIGPLGLLAGSFVGALAGAVLDGRRLTAAPRIALAAVVGAVGGLLVQFVIGAGLILAFVLALLA